MADAYGQPWQRRGHVWMAAVVAMAMCLKRALNLRRINVCSSDSSH